MQADPSLEPGSIPRDWNVTFFLSLGGTHRAVVSHSGVHMCNLSISTSSLDEDSAKALLLQRAARWINDYRAREASR